MLKKSAQSQSGVALVLAMLIVALVTTVVVAVSWRFTLSMARNENRWHGSQARAYLEGAEEFFRKALIDDVSKGQIDHLGQTASEVWSVFNDQPTPLEEEDGWIRGRLEDAHGRFNLNLLGPKIVQPVDPNNPAAQPPEPQDGSPENTLSEPQKRFLRLLQMIELDQTGKIQQQQALEIVWAIQDWLDPDDNPSGMGGGAENDYYMGLETPYACGNGEMTSVSEFLLIKGVTPELYRKLQPLLIALPPNVLPNINTLKPELMATLNRKTDLKPLEESSVKLLLDARASKQDGFQSSEEFISDVMVQQVLGDNTQFDAAGWVVASDYFLLFSEVLVGQQVKRGKSLMLRNSGMVTVIRRTDANF